MSATAHAPVHPHPHPTRLGDYQVTGVLGTGACGPVYRARDPVSGRELALKPAPRADHLAAALCHPNIVAVLAFAPNLNLHPDSHPDLQRDSQPNSNYIVLEYVDGPTLHTVLAQRRPTPAESVAWMRQLLAALDHAHGRGVIHRDIKPANLLIDARAQLKVSDFGIASVAPAQRAVGTPHYLAPECLRGQAAHAGSDLYAAGVVLYQLLTGARPRSGSAFEVIQQALGQQPVAPSLRMPALGRRYDALLGKALATSAGARFQTAAEFDLALRAATGS